MGKLRSIAKSFTTDELIGESLPKQPIIELFSDNRVYIERHLGVYAYSDTQIHIGVHFGQIVINGSCLKMARISKENLVVTGQIRCIELIRG